MEERIEQTELLALIGRPAFLVRDAAVVAVNDAARRRMVSVGDPLDALLATGEDEYAAFTDGELYLRLHIAGHDCGAAVSRLRSGDVFVLESEEDLAELQALALAAQQLRLPLANTMTVADALYPVAPAQDDPTLLDQVCRINRGLYQLQRIVCNMADAYRYCQEQTPQLEMRNICQFFREQLEKAAAVLLESRLTLQYSLPEKDIYCLIDAEKLERALLNMISNAMKFTTGGSVVSVRLTQRENTLHLTVEDRGEGIATEIKTGLLSRYRREPGIEDGRQGLGLGMVIIRSAAAAQGGTVLIRNPQEGGTQITMTIPIRQDTDVAVNNALLPIDYAGEQDHLLLELSESLPPSVYQKSI